MNNSPGMIGLIKEMREGEENYLCLQIFVTWFQRG